MDAGTPGRRGCRSRRLPLASGNDVDVQPMGASPSSRYMGRPRGILSRAVGSRARAEGATVGLLPIWWWFAHVHGNVTGPTGDTAGAGYHSSTLCTARAITSFSSAPTSYHATFKIRSSCTIRAYPSSGRRGRTYEVLKGEAYAATRSNYWTWGSGSQRHRKGGFLGCVYLWPL